MLQRSQQVKSGIRLVGGKKRFDGFGRAEVATFAGVPSPTFVDLVDLCPASVALSATSFIAQNNTYQQDQMKTTSLEHEAKKFLQVIVNPVDGD